MRILYAVLLLGCTAILITVGWGMHKRQVPTMHGTEISRWDASQVQDFRALFSGCKLPPLEELLKHGLSLKQAAVLIRMESAVEKEK